VAGSAPGSAPGHAAADSGAGGKSPDAETPQVPTLTSAGRRFAARIEEFVKGSDRQTAGGSRIVATDAPAAAVPRVAVIAPVAPAAPPAEPTSESFERLVQSIRIQVRQGISEATIRLQPEHLGAVTILIKLDRGAVSAVINAEAGDVCEWLRGQEDAIRRSLSEQGMQLERFLVQRDGSRERRERPPQPEKAPPPREPGDDTPRFEVAA
jgi:flagellar hook-length control protein FliK